MASSKFHLPACTLTVDETGCAQLDARYMAATFLVTKTPVWTEMAALIDDEVPELARLAVKQVFAHVLCAVHGFGRGIGFEDATTDITTIDHATLQYDELETQIFGTYQKASNIRDSRTPHMIILVPSVSLANVNTQRNYDVFGRVDEHVLYLLDQLYVDEKIVNLLFVDGKPTDEFQITCLNLITYVAEDADRSRIAEYANDEQMLTVFNF